MITKKFDDLLLKKFDTREEMGKQAGLDVITKIKELLAEKKSINIIFAAAPSQNEFLNTLVQDNGIDFSRINAFHMDEYVGLDKDAPQGFGNFLKDRLFGKVSFKTVNYINGQAQNPVEECERYTKLLQNEKIDIVCMGIGENAHIAFNDPHVAFFNDEKLVKIVELDNVCRIQQVNDGCFKKLDDVPTLAITLTIPALVNADCLYCMVPAITKANAVYNSLCLDISEQYPASILRTCENAAMYVDSDSGSLLD